VTNPLPRQPTQDIDHNDSFILAFGAFTTGILGLTDTAIINNWNDDNGG
jgi:hypothetical protein